MLNRKTDFILNGDIDFKDRQKTIFDVLDKITPENCNVRYSEDEFNQSESKVVIDPNKKELKLFRGKESIFKIPELPRKRPFQISMPDFVRNPHKWKKYRMENELMNDKSNATAAMTFLKEMENRIEPMETDEIDTKGPIVFNKHIKIGDEMLATEVPVTSSYVNGKRVMPEYVVGQKIKKKVTFKKSIKSDIPSTNVKLDHLFNEDEEE